MEQKIYYKLSDNADLRNYYLPNMQAVAEHIETEVRDTDQSEIENIEYTIQPVLLTQEEFENLPEYEF